MFSVATTMGNPDVFDGESDGSDLSESFEDRQLISAEGEAVDELLPAVEGLRISGDAVLGGVLRVGGKFINGTTHCHFAWVRYSGSGSCSYIEGEKGATYILNADDVDSYLAVEVIPVDAKGAMGDLERIFASEHRKISCGPILQEQIERTFFLGFASFYVSVVVCRNIWRRAQLRIKRKCFSIKYDESLGSCFKGDFSSRAIVVKEEFSLRTAITIPNGQGDEFIIICTSGKEYFLKTEDISLRDIVVLTMRLFVVMAMENKRKKRSCFSKQ